MNPEDFIKAIKVAVRDSTIEGIAELLEHPPGRKPDAELLALAQWFRSLSESDKQQVRKVAELATDHSIFGFLCVLDGVRTIEDTPAKGSLTLTFSKDGHDTVLNNPAEEELHNIFKMELNKGSGQQGH